MDLIRGRQNFSSSTKPSVVSIGNFDGVHLGHLRLIEMLHREAHRAGVPATVLTFDPHPHEFFSAETAPPRLSTFRGKLEQLNKAGVDKVVCLRFNALLARMSAEEFVKVYLINGLGVRALIVGDDFRFGRDRKGDFSLLQEMGRQADFAVSSVETFVVDGHRVSSSRIRQILQDADFPLAERLLGRPFTVAARVAHGDKRGRTWGFPTANLMIRHSNLPVGGVYAATVSRYAGERLHGVVNVGFRPTVGGKRFLVEVHLLNYDERLYGQRLTVEFRHKIRPEKHFESFDHLKAQIGRDIGEAHEFLRQMYPL